MRSHLALFVRVGRPSRRSLFWLSILKLSSYQMNEAWRGSLILRQARTPAAILWLFSSNSLIQATISAIPHFSASPSRFDICLYDGSMQAITTIRPGRLRLQMFQISAQPSLPNISCCPEVVAPFPPHIYESVLYRDCPSIPCIYRKTQSRSRISTSAETA